MGEIAGKGDKNIVPKDKPVRVVVGRIIRHPPPGTTAWDKITIDESGQETHRTVYIPTRPTKKGK